ncbi:MAG: oligosaccharide flippase family protein [Anaerolineae bacterium]|nr:oligosaccharide flippase family protein [Anaerolineae bacterium]
MRHIQPLSLRKNFSWTFVGNGVYAASQWGILVVLAKLGTPEVVGQFALGLALTAPIVLFANLQLRAVQATDARRDYQFADYLGLRLLTTAAALTVIVLLALLGGYRAETAAVIILIGLSKSFEAISDVFFGLLQQQERMDRIAKSLMIEGPATLVVMAIIMLLTRNVVLAVAGMAVVWGLQLLLYDRRSGLLILRDQGLPLRPRFHLRDLRRLAWLALPLGFVMMLNSLVTNIPRYVIENQLGGDQLGIFAAMAYLIVAGVTVISALGQSLSPRMATYYAEGAYRAFGGLLLKFVGIAIGLGVCAVVIALLFGETILALLYGAAYADYHDVLVLLMLAGGLAYVSSAFGYTLTAMRYFRVQVLLYAIYATTALIAATILVGRYGLQGGALTLCVVYVIEITLGLSLVLWALRQRATRA